MVNLPDNKNLTIANLAACFNNTTTPYKFYWLLSILNEVETGNLKIYKRDLYTKMISTAWYTVNYFHVSFGYQDKLQEAIRLIKEAENLNIDAKRTEIEKVLNSTSNKSTIKQLSHFNKNVPHWFLSPWFPDKTEKEIYKLSKKDRTKCLYGLHDDFIQINPIWINYLVENSKILKDFCYWNLTTYLQKRNPNVPAISSKLIQPIIRKSLIKQKNKFWDIVIREHGGIKCIYTGKKIRIGDYALDHFVPYGFVSHDLIWNLIPSDKIFNIKKSDKLPSIEKYIKPFYETHKTALEIISIKDPENIFLQDYLTIFPDINEVKVLSTFFTRKVFEQNIKSLINIASNNCFEFYDKQ
jgi:hypothetical protein